MFSRFFTFVLLACPCVLSIPTTSSNMNSIQPTSNPFELMDLPDELLTKIVDDLDNDSSLNMGMTSTYLKAVTRKKNERIRLLKHCGSRAFLHLTSNGHHLLSESISDFPTHEKLEDTDFIKRKALCIRALEANIHDIGDRLTELEIYFPDNPYLHSPLSPEVKSAVQDYLKALEALFKKKSSYQKVSMFSGQTRLWPRYLESRFKDVGRHNSFVPQDIEEWIIRVLPGLKIDFLDIGFRMHRPHLLVNPSIKKFSASVGFSRETYPSFPALNIVVFQGNDHVDYSRGKYLSFMLFIIKVFRKIHAFFYKT